MSKLNPIQVLHEIDKDLARVSGAESAEDAWFALEMFLCGKTFDDDEFIFVIRDGHTVTAPNEDGEYVFKVILKEVVNNEQR